MGLGLIMYSFIELILKENMQLSAIIGALIFFTILLVISIGFSVRMNKINHNKHDHLLKGLKYGLWLQKKNTKIKVMQKNC